MENTNTVKAVNKMTGEVLLMTAEAAAKIKEGVKPAPVINFEEVEAQAAAKVKAAEVKAAKASEEAAARLEEVKKEVAAEVKATKALRNKKGEAVVKLRHAIDETAEGIEAAKASLGLALDEVKDIKPDEVTRPEAITAAEEAMKAYLTNMTAAKVKAAEALAIEGGSLTDRTKTAKLKNLLAEVEGLKTAAEAAAEVIREAAEEAVRPLTKAEKNAKIKRTIEEEFTAKAGKITREEFWTAYIEANFAVKPSRATYEIAFGKEEGRDYFEKINKLFEKFLDRLLDVREAFGKEEEYKVTENEAYNSLNEIMNKLYLVNLNNCGVSDTLVHTLAARGYNWRIEYNKDDKPQIVAIERTNNAVLFEVFAEITKPEAITAAKAKREEKRRDRVKKAKDKAAKKEAKKPSDKAAKK